MIKGEDSPQTLRGRPHSHRPPWTSRLPATGDLRGSIRKTAVADLSLSRDPGLGRDFVSGFPGSCNLSLAAVVRRSTGAAALRPLTATEIWTPPTYCTYEGQRERTGLPPVFGLHTP